MAKVTQRRSPMDWIEAGFRAVATGGPPALRVEALAREIGTSKGSFYWHFKDLADLKSRMLDHWQATAVSGVIDQLSQYPAGQAQLKRLVEVASHTPKAVGGAQAEPAIRDWARYDVNVAEVLGCVDRQRLDWLGRAFTAAGQRDPAAAALQFYASLIGLEQLCDQDAQRQRALEQVLQRLLS